MKEFIKCYDKCCDSKSKDYVSIPFTKKLPVGILDLPVEILNLIFEELSIHDIENCSRTSRQWQAVVSEFFFKGHLKMLAENDEGIKKRLNENEWTEDCTDVRLITRMYFKFKCFKATIYVLDNAGDPCNKLNITSQTVNLLKPQNVIKELVDVPSRSLSVRKLTENYQNNISWNFVSAHYGHVIDGFCIFGSLTGAASVTLNATTMWIVGCSNYGYGNATEFIKLEQGTGDYIPDEMADGNYSDIPIPSPTYLNRGKGALKCPMKGPYLPFKIYDHSVEKYDDSNIYIIGGYVTKEEEHIPELGIFNSKGEITNETWIADPKTLFNDNFQLSPGPPLNSARKDHFSGKFVFNGKTMLVVAGGRYGNIKNRYSCLDSVEILDPSSDEGWQPGPKLPLKLYNALMLTSPNGEGVLVIGGCTEKEDRRKNVVNSDAIFLLKVTSMQKMKWVRVDQKVSPGKKKSYNRFPIMDSPLFWYTCRNKIINKKYL